MSSLLDQVGGRTSIVDEVLTGDLGEGDRLAGVELVGCTLRDASWAGAQLAGVRLERCTVERVDLSRIRLPDTVLDDCTFIGCKALATSWSTLRAPVITPEPSTWVDCQLSMGSFTELDLTGARFERCVLTDADFDGAVLREIVVEDCSLGGARFVRADLAGADLRGARDYIIDPRETTVRGLVVDRVGALGLLAPFAVVVD
ncbi:pentapeptide repeat-containing protein [Janibacter sp. DB-40]|uniref:pentapeptide repeat-containing protein n=1 Tax=Janibacter sp. DB-40 TaxID=3028808 RepID=UPI002406FDCB|nr:pentapeptide repeat-containing protein [Janibacter sp. DB-40]